MDSKSPERKKARTKNFDDENDSQAANSLEVDSTPPVKSSSVIEFTPTSSRGSLGSLGGLNFSSDEGELTPEISSQELEKKRKAQLPPEDSTISLSELHRMMAEEGEDSDIDSPYAKHDDRRNTASPSTLRQLMEDMSDEEEDSTEKAVPINTRSSTKKHFENVFSADTPLKSCMSARKTKRLTTTGKKKKSVVFGSPNAAEFDTSDPVRGGVTPLTKTYARQRFKMQEAALLEEDAETAHNSSILATWEEEADDSDSRRGSSGSKRSSRRLSSAGFEKPDLQPFGDLQDQFDAVQDPPSPSTAEHLVKEGKGIALMYHESSGDTVDLTDIAAMIRSPKDDEEDHTVPLGSLSELASLSPANVPRLDYVEESETTVELGALSSLASFDSPSKQNEDSTVELGTLSSLASFDRPAKPQEDSTVELGTLSSLASFDSPAVSVAGSIQQTEDATIEIVFDNNVGSLSNLSRLSLGSENQRPSTGKKQPMFLSFLSDDSGKTPKSTKAFDTAAILDHCMDSPSDLTPKKTSPEYKEEHVMIDEEEEMGFVPKNGLPRTPLQQSRPSTPPKSRPSTPPTPIVDGIVDDSVQAEEAIVEQVPDIEGQNLLSFAELLELCSIKIVNECAAFNEPQETFEMNSPMLISPADLSAQVLFDACTHHANRYGLRWACNEVKSRIASSKRIILELSRDVEEKACRYGREELVTELVQLHVECAEEAALAWYDIKIRYNELSQEALNEEHTDVLGEDQNVIQDGLVRLDVALKDVNGGLNIYRRMISLLQELAEQNLVASQYEEQLKSLKTKETLGNSEYQRCQENLQRCLNIRVAYEKRLVENSNMGCLKEQLEKQNKIAKLAFGLCTWQLFSSAERSVTFIWRFLGLSFQLQMELENGTDVSSISLVTPSPIKDGGSFVDMIAGVAYERLDHRVASFNPGQRARDVLRHFDLEFGRLEDLFVELVDANNSAPIPCTLVVGGTSSMLFSASFLHSAQHALIKAEFEINTRYPISQDSCIFRFSIKSNNDVEELRKQVESDCTNSESREFHAFSRMWKQLSYFNC